MKVDLVGISNPNSKNSPAHSHSGWEIVLNLEGEGTTDIENRSYPFDAGTIICIPPNTAHSKSSSSYFRDIYFQTSDFPLPNTESASLFCDDEEKSFEALLTLAFRTFHKKESNYIPLVDSLTETMHQLLLSWAGGGFRNESVELLKNELTNHFTNPELQIVDAMKKAAYSTDHLRRCFKKDTGTTPISYLMNLRIEYAKKLLCQKSNMKMSISEISYLSGFYDPQYFSRVFKKTVGKTPQQYAEQK